MKPVRSFGIHVPLCEEKQQGLSLCRLLARNSSSLASLLIVALLQSEIKFKSKSSAMRVSTALPDLSSLQSSVVKWDLGLSTELAGFENSSSSSSLLPFFDKSPDILAGITCLSLTLVSLFFSSLSKKTPFFLQCSLCSCFWRCPIQYRKLLPAF